MAKIGKNVIFIGRVQGVGFRYTAQRAAGKYDVSGYVKNLPTGEVEMLAQGEKSEVDSLISEICEYFGGYIRDKKINEVPYTPAYHDFRIAF